MGTKQDQTRPNRTFRKIVCIVLYVYDMIVRIETKLYRKTSSIVIPLRTGPDRITCSNYSSESIGIYEFD